MLLPPLSLDLAKRRITFNLAKRVTDLAKRWTTLDLAKRGALTETIDLVKIGTLTVRGARTLLPLSNVDLMGFKKKLICKPSRFLDLFSIKITTC